ncbi:transglycosylase domain-containing protein [Pseudonocardia asaccharolytica]|uniref:transglycosylase domain-containing protein n=1 Tax=Pseudonocardia asaccharolytica TaxID=54010 RepID=UPI0006890384|nr:transglycosylase domain-containing protein [Pseudonocardia asaccharolytica]
MLAPLGRALGAVVLAGVLLAGVLLVPTTALARIVAAAPPVAAPTGPPVPGHAPLASVITDAAGVPFARLYEQYRIPTEPGEIAEAMKAAVVAIEDRRFFVHDGVDWRGVGRAILTNLALSGAPFDGQGASTITMQYAKNLRLYAMADSAEERAAAVADTMGRKLADVRTALRLERRLGKQEILARYLNTVYFGHSAYGVAAAARTYFATSPAELTLPQAALLAGMIKAPSTFDPVSAPAAARARRDLVLTAMAEVGSITERQADAARAQGLGAVEPLRRTDAGCVGADPGSGFFCRYVVDYLESAGLDVAELRTGGYTVRTTLDRRVTAAAVRAAAQVPADATEGIANAMAIVAPGREHHRVLALAANRTLGTDAAVGQTAYALPSAPVPHGAGSIFKIFTAAAAMERGLGIHSPVPAPERYTSRMFRDGGRPYTVTGGGGAADETTLQGALALSPNTTFVALLDGLGSVDPVVEMARRLGLRRSLALPAEPDATIGEVMRAEERASFTLGPVPVVPLELANVGATLVSGGVWCPPTPILEVTDRTGAPIALPEAPCERAIPEGLADTLVVGLSDDTVYGTAAGAADAAGWNRPMLGKTGTTQHHFSAGFVGATPQLAGAVLTWSDADPPRPICVGDPPRLCADGTLFGGTVPAATWFAAMRPLHAGLPVASLPEPDPRHLTGGIGSGDD